MNARHRIAATASVAVAASLAGVGLGTTHSQDPTPAGKLKMAIFAGPVCERKVGRGEDDLRCYQVATRARVVIERVDQPAAPIKVRVGRRGRRDVWLTAGEYRVSAERHHGRGLGAPIRIVTVPPYGEANLIFDFPTQYVG